MDLFFTDLGIWPSFGISVVGFEPPLGTPLTTPIHFLMYLSSALSRGVLKLRICFMHSHLEIYSQI
jgi:hypothetical protein